jgi:Domain of unknown function (DUF4371)/hAT family C-terminal dimerisation region
LAMKRVHPSGFQKRTEMAKKIAASVDSVPKINSFFKTLISNVALEDETVNMPMPLPLHSEEQNMLVLDATSNEGLPVSETVITAECVSTTDADSTHELDTDSDSFYDQTYPTDRGNFDDTILDTDLKKKIVLFGPCQPHIPFPSNDTGRKFSVEYYSTVTKAGMKIRREWLCYSVKTNTVYCDSCWLFADRCSTNFRPEWVQGLNDWKHLSEKIKIHQQSQVHVDAVIVHQRWKRGECIDEALDEQIREESQLWIKLLRRLTDIVLTLAENNLAFRGDREVINEASAGNFLALVALVARYDPVLEEIVKRPAGSCKYLSPAIQNELISSASSAVKKQLLHEIREAPFYSILADGTQDITKQDQISCVIRYVAIDSDKCTIEVKESFLGFFNVVDQSAKGMVELFKSILSDVNVNKCRGQGYDGASVMSGKMSGVHKRMQDNVTVNNALYVHCCAHNLNLVLCDAAEASSEVKTFFAVIQEIYNYLGGSAPRWAVLQAVGEEVCGKLDKNNSKITIKKLCPTRWESRHQAVSALLLRYADVLKTLTKLSLTAVKPEARQQASALRGSIEKFEFVFLLVIWEKILRHVNVVSKLMQAKEVDLNLVTELLNTTVQHFREMRASFTSHHDEAIAYAEKYKVTSHFKEARNRKTKRFHDELANDERLLNSLDKFRVTIFNLTIDTCINKVLMRFESFRAISTRFGFMMPAQLNQISDDDLCTSTTEFARLYEDDVSEDVVRQFRSLRSCFCFSQAKGPRDVLQFIVENKLQSTMPDVVTCYMLFLTLPVTVASCERSFSKLRMIKNYLRSSCGQERLSGLALLSIESKVARSLNLDDLIKNFASMKVRRKKVVN